MRLKIWYTQDIFKLTPNYRLCIRQIIDYENSANIDNKDQAQANNVQFNVLGEYVGGLMVSDVGCKAGNPGSNPSHYSYRC